MSERQMPELADPEDMEIDLAARSESIGATLDAAFEHGYDYYSADGDKASEAAKWDHPKLVKAFGEGWDAAAQDEARACVRS